KLSFWLSGVIRVTGRDSAASVAKKALCLPKVASAPEAVGIISLSGVEPNSVVTPALRPLVGGCWGNTAAGDTTSGGANLTFTISWPGNRLVTVSETGAWVTWACAVTIAHAKSVMQEYFFMMDESDAE